MNAGNTLTFEPTFFGGNFLYQDLGRFSGRYLALSTAAVPEPSMWALMLLGIGAIGATMRAARGRTRRRIGYT